MARRILLHSGWDTHNLGDVGHTPGALRLLEQYLPGVPVTLWLHAASPEVEAMLQSRFPGVTIVQGEIADGQVRGEALAKAFADAGLFIRASGMGWPFESFDFCRARGLPYGVIGHSFEDGFPYGNPALVDTLSAAAFIYPRESNTLETLRRAGVTTPRLAFVPDTCLATDIRDDAAGEAFLRHHGLTAGEFLTFHLRTYTPKFPGQDGGRLNPLHPIAENQALDESRAAAFREVLTGWIRQTGLPALLALEVRKEHAHNLQLVVAPLPDDVRARVVVPETFWTMDLAAAVLARARVVLCHEPHTPLLALANGVPVLHAYTEDHGPKWRMFNDFGLPEALVSLDRVPPAGLLQALLTLSAEGPTARERIRLALEMAHLRWSAALGPWARELA